MQKRLLHWLCDARGCEAKRRGEIWKRLSPTDVQLHIGL
jgi:hypothetical protein